MRTKGGLAMDLTYKVTLLATVGTFVFLTAIIIGMI